MIILSLEELAASAPVQQVGRHFRECDAGIDRLSQVEVIIESLLDPSGLREVSGQERLRRRSRAGFLRFGEGSQGLDGAAVVVLLELEPLETMFPSVPDGFVEALLV
ncbi:MAG: hypothetical protein P8020_16800 [Acidobacteriota bacterium]